MKEKIVIRNEEKRDWAIESVQEKLFTIFICRDGRALFSSHHAGT